MEYKTEINWYDLKDYEIIYLNGDTIKGLINQGISKAGSLSKLSIKINSGQFYNILKDNEGISIKILKKLVKYIGVDFNSINNKIVEIRKGNKASIKNPIFPINLQNYNMGYLIGHLMSDGCLYKDNSRKDLIRTKYCNDDKEGIDNFVKSLNEVFGNVHFNQEIIRSCIQIRIGNGIVGESFRRAGVTVGKKYRLNESLPWIVKNGDEDTKRAYLSAVFDDEGCVGRNKFPYLTLSRNIHVNFSDREKKILEEHVVPLMNSNSFPTGHITRRIQIRRLKEVLTKINQVELLGKVLDSKPRLLVDESELLKNDFGINNRVYVMSLQLTTNSNYSVQSCLLIYSKRDVAKFYNDIGFSLSKKQKKLKEALISRRWLDNGDETI